MITNECLLLCCLELRIDECSFVDMFLSARDRWMITNERL